VSGGAATGGAVIEHRPSRTADAMCDHLRLARPEIPVLDARSNRDVRDTVLLRPFHRCCRCPVFPFADTNLLDDGVWNQDCWSEALDQVEAGDAREQNEW
jgi:hypothetical protein